MRHPIYLNREMISGDIVPEINRPSPNQDLYYRNHQHARWESLDNKITNTFELVSKNSFYLYEQMNQLKKIQNMMENELKNQLITGMKSIEREVQNNTANFKSGQNMLTNKLINIDRTMEKEQELLSNMSKKQDTMAKRLVTHLRSSYEKLIEKIDAVEEDKITPIHSVLLAISPNTEIANVVIAGQLVEGLIFINYSPAHRLATFQMEDGGLIVMNSEQIYAISLQG